MKKFTKTLLTFIVGLCTPLQAAKQAEKKIYIINFSIDDNSSSDFLKSSLRLVAVDDAKNINTLKKMPIRRGKIVDIYIIDLMYEKKYMTQFSNDNSWINTVYKKIEETTENNRVEYSRKKLDKFFKEEYGNKYKKDIYELAYNAYKGGFVWTFKNNRWEIIKFDDYFVKELDENDDSPENKTPWKKYLLWGVGITSVIGSGLGLVYLYQQREKKEKENKVKPVLN